MVINSIAQTDFQKQYIDQSEQDKKDTIDFYKSYLPELTTPQESLDLQSKRMELDAIQQEQQERATFFDKAATTKDIYLKNTIVGSITEKLGITNYKVNASDYDKEDGFEPDKNVVVDFALQNRANDDEIETMLNSKSTAHLQAIMENIKTSKQAEQDISKVLSNGEQIFAGLLSAVDVDLGLSIGIPVLGAKKILQVGEAGKKMLALASGSVSASKPFIVAKTFDTGEKNNELFLESLLYGGLEALSVYKFTPQITKEAIGSEISNSLASKAYNFGENPKLKQIDLSNTEQFKFSIEKPTFEAHELIQYPKIEAQTAEAIDKTVENLVEQEVKNIAGETFNKVGLKSDIAGYAHASSDIGEMVDKVIAFVRENPIDNVLVGKAIVIMRKEIEGFLKGVEGLEGLTAKQLTKIKLTAQTALKNLEDGVLADTKVQSKLADDFLSRVKGNDAELAKYINTTKLERLKEQTEALKAEIDNLSKGNVSAKDKKIIDVKTKKVEVNTKKIERERSNLQNKVQADLIEEEATAIRLVRDGENYRFGKKLIPFAVVAGLFGATSAFAGDGEKGAGDVFVSDLKGLLLLGVVAGLGYQGYKSLKMQQAIAERVNKVAGQTQLTAKEAEKQNKALQLLRGNYEFARTAFTETFSPLMQYAKQFKDTQLEEFLNKVLVNPMEGKSVVGELSKSRILHEFLKQYKNSEDELFKAWFAKQELTQAQRLLEPFTRQKLEEFRELVTNAKDNALSVPELGREEVVKMAKQSRALLEKHGVEVAKEVGLDGAEAMKALDDYVKRSYRPDAKMIINNLSKESLSVLKNMYKDMYLSSIASSVRALSSATTKTEKIFSKFTSIDDFKNFMKTNEDMFSKVTSIDGEAKALLEEASSKVDLGEAQSAYSKFAEHVNMMVSDEKANAKIDKYFEHIMSDKFKTGVADVFGSFKDRLPLDLSKFRTFEATTEDGNVFNLSMQMLLERNDYTLVHSYMNQLSGRIGLKRAGYSVEEAENIIANIKDSRARNMADSTLKAMLGQPLFRVDEKVQTALQISSNTSMAMSMPLVGFSFAQELGYLLARGLANPNEGGMILRELYGIIKNHGADSALVTSLRERAGLGISTEVGNIGSRIDTEMLEAGFHSASNNFALGFSKVARDAVFKYSGLLKLSDMLELANGVANMQRLAEVSHGKKVLSPTMAKKYGFTPDDLEFAKKHMQFNSKGNVIEPKWDTMSSGDVDRLSTMIITMGQTGAQRTSLGGTASWTRDNVLGNSFSKLVMYTMNSYANLGLHQLRGVAHGDVETSLTAIFGYAGSYVGSKLRDEFKGKERKEEEYHAMALMSVPVLAPLSLAKSLSDPNILAAPKFAVKTAGSLFMGVSQ